jgi:N utilization substance protein B
MTGKSTKAKSAARLAAVQALYQMDVGGVSLDEVIAEFEAFRLGKETDGVLYRDADAGYFHRLVSGVVSAQRELDPKIHAALQDWPLARIDVTLRAILRAAAQELLANHDVPARVVINEYVDIAKAFFDGEEPGIVNGVLDTLARRLRPAEFSPDRKAQGGG